jgi:catechol 2,3-dioxygenase-like lactoylglutathione lyase family enzyme
VREVFGGVRVVTFVSRDLARARDFYVERLGLRLEQEEPGAFLLLNAGTFRLCIDAADAAHPARGGGAKLVFRVRNVARTARELEARGVGYECHTGRRVGDYLETSDPDGYRLVFTEKL